MGKLMQKITNDELIGYMVDFLNRNDQLPTQQKIAEHFGVYPNAITERLLKLEKMGILERNEVGKYMFSRP